MHQKALIDLPLWKRFEERASPAQQASVTWLIEHAEPLLVLIRDTFPTYTRHDKVHSNNVVHLMGELLGPAIDKVTALEAALLILGAYYHDIGMVFTDAERDGLSGEREFATFKASCPDVVVSLQKQGGRVSVDIAERFCRWIHHERVALFLRDIEANTKTEGHLRWGGGKSFKNALRDVCRSHGHDIKLLNDDDTFKTDFRADVGDDSEADLRFCAILLRLADILDFDNTRAPEEIYRYLGLEQRASKRTSASDVEWLKHLAAIGFMFPRQRKGRYAIDFVAGPDHPAVEHDLREFLDVIENEMNKGASMLTKCSPRWRDFQLPGEITRNHIDSEGYKFGDYRFQLEQRQILNLLMGENLYEDPFVFVRELLQNAIDTTRHRLFFETENKDNTAYEPGITVSQWRDTDNYSWVRIDDNGMGMSEEIIANYLLKVGKSYYSSAEFEAEKIGYQKTIHKDFTPISRFGIGLLSCFIAGDRVEISTRSARNPDAIRLSLAGLHGFYTLQSESARHDQPKEMPGKSAQERRGYRAEVGTTVAVRLDPARLDAGFDLKTLLADCVLCSPVPIVFEGEVVGGDPSEIVESPWIDEVISEPLTAAEVAKLEQLRGSAYKEPPRVNIVALDLTKHSPNPDFKGQLLAFSLTSGARAGLTVRIKGKQLTMEAKFGDEQVEREYQAQRDRLDAEMIAQGDARASPVARRNYHERLRRLAEHREKHGVRRTTINLSWILAKHASALERAKDRLYPDSDRWLSHNGIRVPVRVKEYEQLQLSNFTASRRSEEQGCLVGAVALTDGLRPDISLSRDQFRRLPWNIFSTGTLALQRALHSHLSDCEPERQLAAYEIPDLFGGVSPAMEDLYLGNILKDPYVRVDGEWAAQPIIHTSLGVMSLKAIREKLRNGMVTPLELTFTRITSQRRSIAFTACCAAALMQIGLGLKLKGRGYVSVLVVEEAYEPTIQPGQLLFPPLFFVPYADLESLHTPHSPLNQKHPFSKWLIQNAQTLHDRYPSMFEFIRTAFLDFSGYASAELIMKINRALERLRELDPQLGPPATLKLNKNDFES